jgi:DNA polymerase-4
LADRLEADGLTTNRDLRNFEVTDLVSRYGRIGKRLHELSRGIDNRRVNPDQPVKSISSETTFDDDIGDGEKLIGHLWRLAVRTSDRAKSKGMGGRTVVVKLKTADFRTITRQSRLSEPTNLADLIYSVGEPLLLGEIENGPFRLIGIGLSVLSELQPDGSERKLFQDERDPHQQAERATDEIRNRFGRDAIIRGRSLR